MKDCKKIKRAGLAKYYSDSDSELDFTVPTKDICILTSKNNILNRINAQWYADFFQGLLKESFENIQKNILDFERKYGENSIQPEIKENFSNPEIFSAYVDEAIITGIFFRMLNDLIANKDSFYDEKICKIFEDKKFLQNCVKETERDLIEDLYTAASQHGSEDK